MKIKRILKVAREKQIVNYKGVPIRLSVNFSKETLQTGRDRQDIFKVMKGKDLQSRLLYPAKLSLGIVGEIKCFPKLSTFLKKKVNYSLKAEKEINSLGTILP